MSTIKRWVRQLHRRSVWQVLVVYAGASWAVLEVVDTLTAVLRLPRWFPDLAIVLLLVGLPFVLATAFIRGPTPFVDVGEPGDGPAGPTEAAQAEANRAVRRGRASGGGPWLTWRNVLAAGVVAWALWGVAAAVWLLTRADGIEATGGEQAIVAVLPLEDPRADSESDWFATGMTDQLITDLSRIGHLTVINAGSSFRYLRSEKPLSEIGRELNATVLLVGSVLRQGGNVRVNARLVDVPSERLRWAESYQRPLMDVLALQAEVARDVATQVRAVVGLPAEPSGSGDIPTRRVDPEAHALYLEGRALYRAPSAENLSASIALFRRALEIDPEFALAWAALADSYLVAAHVNATPDEAFRASIDAALQALDLDPDLAEAHTALADSRYHFAFDYEAAEAGFRRGLELSPSYATAHWWYGGLLATLGRFDEALVQIARARVLDPRAPIIPAFHARVLYYARKYAAAEATVRRAAEGPYPVQLTHGALAVFRLGRPAEALDLIAGGTTPYDMAARVQIYAGTGRAGQAEAILDRLHAMWRLSFVPPHLLAAGHAAVGDTDTAMDWLETAYELRDPALIWVHIDPAFDVLDGDPRFDRLLRRMGLPTG